MRFILTIVGSLVASSLNAQTYVSDITACGTDMSQLKASEDIGIMTNSGFESPLQQVDLIVKCSWEPIPELVWEGETVISSYGYCSGTIPRPAVFNFWTSDTAPGVVAVITSIDQSPIYKFHRCDNQ